MEVSQTSMIEAWEQCFPGERITMVKDAHVERFYRVLWPQRAAVLRTAKYLCRDQNESEDLAQEVFIKAFGSIEQLVDEAGAVRWLMAILRNLRIDRLRARRRHPPLSVEALEFEPAAEEEAVEAPANLSAEELLESISDQEIIDALHALPEEIRWTLLLVDVHGMDQAEAAAIEGVPVGTIKSRAHRGRLMMKGLLAERFAPGGSVCIR
jgi:RNA polymerase sigma-70 factor (ECF subfamily)